MMPATSVFRAAAKLSNFDQTSAVTAIFDMQLPPSGESSPEQYRTPTTLRTVKERVSTASARLAVAGIVKDPVAYGTGSFTIMKEPGAGAGLVREPGQARSPPRPDGRRRSEGTQMTGTQITGTPEETGGGWSLRVTRPLSHPPQKVSKHISGPQP